MDKKILAVVAVVVIIIAAAAVIMLKPGDSDKDSEKSGYTVSFDANGGSGTMDPVKNVSGKYYMPECKFTAPTNHSFIGWSFSPNAGFIFNVGAEMELEEDTTLYARWNDDTSLGILIKANGYVPDDPIVSDLKFIYKTGNVSYDPNIEEIKGNWRYYGEGSLTINIEGSSDWSYHTGKLVDDDKYDSGIFNFTYNGKAYMMSFTVPDGTISGSVDGTPVFKFSTTGSATMQIILTEKE